MDKERMNSPGTSQGSVDEKSLTLMLQIDSRS